MLILCVNVANEINEGQQACRSLTRSHRRQLKHLATQKTSELVSAVILWIKEAPGFKAGSYFSSSTLVGFPRGASVVSLL